MVAAFFSGVPDMVRSSYRPVVLSIVTRLHLMTYRMRVLMAVIPSFRRLPEEDKLAGYASDSCFGEEV